MAVAQADIGHEDHIALLLNETQAKEILDLRPVDLRRPTPLELIERLEHRQSSQPDSSLDAAIFTRLRLPFDQARQIVHV